MRRRRKHEHGLVDEVVSESDEHSAASGGGFDLSRIALSDASLIDHAMRAFSIDAKAPNAREQLHRVLSRTSRTKKRGRKSDDPP